MPNKYYLRSDRMAVTKEQYDRVKSERPNPGLYEDLLKYYDDFREWDQKLFDLPALDVDPDYLKRLSPGWFEGEEQYEVYYNYEWQIVGKSTYDITLHNKRLTIVAPQEAEKGQEGDDIVDMIDKANAEINRSYEAYDKPLQISRVIGTIRVCDTAATKEHREEWVRVEDRLPDAHIIDGKKKKLNWVLGTNGKNQFICVYTKGHEIEYGDDDPSDEEYDEIEDNNGCLYLKPGWYELEETPRGEYDETWVTRTPTHWMPLPKAPTK